MPTFELSDYQAVSLAMLARDEAAQCARLAGGTDVVPGAANIIRERGVMLDQASRTLWPPLYEQTTTTGGSSEA